MTKQSYRYIFPGKCTKFSIIIVCNFETSFDIDQEDAEQKDRLSD